MVLGGLAEAGGAFKMEALPGAYVLTASDMTSGKISRPVSLEIGDQDINGLELELNSGYEIRGRVAVDGSEPIDYSSLMLSFGGQPVKLDSSGAFETALFGDAAFYTLQGLTGNWYVKDFRVAGKRVVGRSFHVDPGTTDIVISLSPHGGQLSVSVTSTPESAAIMLIVLLPESGEIPDVESTVHAMPDASGRFLARAVPPGSYRLFTLDASNWALAMRPDLLLEKHRASAPLVTMQEGEEKSIAIPPQHFEVEQ